MKDYKLSEIKEICVNRDSVMECSHCEFNIKVRSNDFNLISECVFHTPPRTWYIATTQKDKAQEFVDAVMKLHNLVNGDN